MLKDKVSRKHTFLLACFIFVLLFYLFFAYIITSHNSDYNEAKMLINQSFEQEAVHGYLHLTTSYLEQTNK